MGRIVKKLRAKYDDGGIKGVGRSIKRVLKNVFYDIPRYYLILVLRDRRDKRRYWKIKKIEYDNEHPALRKGDYRTHKIGRFIRREVSYIFNWPKILRNRKCRVLVVVHMFYMKSVDEVIEYLKNLKHYNYDLVITYIDKNFSQESLDKIKDFKRDTKFFKYKNKGYDIGPFIDVINKVALNSYDVVIKMQTKSTGKNMFIYNQFFRNRDWFRNLWDGVLGGFSVHNTINKLYKEEKYGLVAAKNLIVKDPVHKQQLTKDLLVKKNIDYIEDYYFVAGSCFAIRSDCLKKIKNAKIKLNDFEDVSYGFSFAHAVERGVCFSILPEYEFYGNKVDFWRHAKWRRVERKLHSMSAMNMLKKLGDYEFSPEYVWANLEHCFLKQAKVEKIPLKKLKRRHPETDEVIGLEKCEPYLYLKGEVEKYKKYCEYHKEDSSLPDMSIKRYEKLIKSIKKNGYDYRKPIIVDDQDCICDGQHRACVLLYLHDGNYKIPVVKISLITIDPGKIRPFSSKVPMLE